MIRITPSTIEMSNQSIDDDLHDAVRLTASVNQATLVYELLHRGANPNYRKKRAHTTIVEYIASTGSAALMWVLLNHKGEVDFNPRRESPDWCPLSSLLGREPTHFTDTLCLCVYRRLDDKLRSNPKSRFLFTALELRRLTFARALIMERHAFSLNGYYHLCATYSHNSDMFDIARLLFEQGYRLTHKAETTARTQQIENQTALSLCVRSPTLNREMFDFLAPFAEVDFLVLKRLAELYLVDDIIRLMKRCNLRSISTDPHQEFSIGDNIIVKSLFYFINRQPNAIAAAMMTTAPMLIQGVRHMDWPVDKRFSDRKRAAYAISLLRQGASTDVSMVGVPGLEGACKPWCERDMHVYYSAAFRQHATHVMIAIHLYRGPQLPFEMKCRIIEHLERDAQ